MDLNEIEAALIDRLKAVFTPLGGTKPALAVEPFPRKPKDYRLTHPKGAVLVRFGGGKYNSQSAMGVVAQERLTEWEITAVARNLRDHAGVYAILDVLRTALTGFTIPGCRKAFPSKEGFSDENDGIWQYVFQLTVPTVNVELAEDEDLPVLKRITLDDNLGYTEEYP